MSEKLSLQSTRELSSGTKIPCIGLGVYQSPPEVTMATVKAAIEAGYRHIDSAHWYFNEAQVGQAAISIPSIPRSSIFLTTKLGHPDKVAERLRESVKLIDPSDGGYVDLFLIHAPWAGPEGRRHQWEEMERLVQEGGAKAIGVSNFGVRHLEEMEKYAKIPPAINQIELHPWCQQPAIVSYCRSHNIALEAYSPLVQGKKAQDPTLQRIAQETGKSWAQVLIRWSLQQGFIPLPKSDTPARIVSNTEVFDFELSEEQMGALNALEANEHVCLDPTNVD